MAKANVTAAEETLLVAVIAETARALRYHEDRATVMRDRRALAFLAGSDARIRVETMAEAAGVSVAAVKWELIRGRKLPLNFPPETETHLLATARSETTLCGIAAADAAPVVLAAHARLHDYEHGKCAVCYATLLG